MPEQKIDLIYGHRTSKGVEADTRDGQLWLSPNTCERATGWTLKAEGFCRGEVCVPLPAARSADFVSGGRYNLAALAKLMGQPAIHDQEHGVWCFGEAASERRRALTSLEAPDFALPDLSGTTHSLSEHRGKKVLLVSWASW